MKKKITTVVALILCAVLLVAGSVAATLAYLTSKTEVVTNTFTVGNVAITLDEAKVNVNGVPVNNEGTVVELASAPRVMTNSYKLIPGESYTKDPTVHVASGSEASFVFVKVVDGIEAIQDATTIANQMIANGWKETATDNVWVYAKDAGEGTHTLVDASQSAKDLIVFNNFKVLSNANVGAYTEANIKIEAFAIQAAGDVDYATALTQATATFTI
ncbi:MAG: hypothetical protein IJ462_02710 [Clostridia bacterium]|nr:hypothetical protein [Clostridia bacterium]